MGPSFFEGAKLFIYLASPYTPHNGESIQERVDAVAKVAAKLMLEGHSVFSPIVHSHYVANDLPESVRFDHEFWMKQDLGILRASAKVIVLKLPEWRKSAGIMREIAEADLCNIPVEFLEHKPL